MAQPNSVKVANYYVIYALIAVLMVLTVALSFFQLGTWNLVLALVIAGVQAGLLSLFFMHLKYSDSLTWLTVGASLFWLGILFVFFFTDYLTRHYGAL